MWRHVIAEAMTIRALSMSILSCSQPVTVPSEIGTVDQLVNALRAQGRAVSVGSENSPARNDYFNVSSRDVHVNEALLKAFEYHTSDRADADAALIRPDGQPNPRVQVGWISAPHFYKQGRLIVLYVGCSGDVVETLSELMGPAIATGPGCN